MSCSDSESICSSGPSTPQPDGWPSEEDRDSARLRQAARRRLQLLKRVIGGKHRHRDLVEDVRAVQESESAEDLKRCHGPFIYPADPMSREPDTVASAMMELLDGAGPRSGAYPCRHHDRRWATDPMAQVMVRILGAETGQTLLRLNLLTEETARRFVSPSAVNGPLMGRSRTRALQEDLGILVRDLIFLLESMEDGLMDAPMRPTLDSGERADLTGPTAAMLDILAPLSPLAELIPEHTEAGYLLAGLEKMRNTLSFDGLSVLSLPYLAPNEKYTVCPGTLRDHISQTRMEPVLEDSPWTKGFMNTPLSSLLVRAGSSEATARLIGAGVDILAGDCLPSGYDCSPAGQAAMVGLLVEETRKLYRLAVEEAKDVYAATTSGPALSVGDPRCGITEKQRMAELWTEAQLARKPDDVYLPGLKFTMTYNQGWLSEGLGRAQTRTAQGVRLGKREKKYKYPLLNDSELEDDALPKSTKRRALETFAPPPTPDPASDDETEDRSAPEEPSSSAAPPEMPSRKRRGGEQEQTVRKRRKAERRRRKRQRAEREREAADLLFCAESSLDEGTASAPECTTPTKRARVETPPPVPPKERRYVMLGGQAVPVPPVSAQVFSDRLEAAASASPPAAPSVDLASVRCGFQYQPLTETETEEDDEDLNAQPDPTAKGVWKE